jgi:succinyl-CoA synthetase beta subunit
LRLLTVSQSKALLAEYGLPVVRGPVARSADEAVRAAAELGGPVVLKVESPDVAHKSDVGGVALHLETADDVRAAYAAVCASVRSRLPGARVDGLVVEPWVPIDREVIVGVKRDPQFGPVLLFGLGGIYAELFDDVALRLLPVGGDEARAMMAETRVHRLLRGLRGRPAVDLDAVAGVLVAVSKLVEATGDAICELDINPLACSPDGAWVVDARVLLKG